MQRCRVRSVHLATPKQPNVWTKGRGVEQRNYGLQWIRSYCQVLAYVRIHCNGVVYFLDDDNRFDLRLFEEVCETQHNLDWIPRQFSLSFS